jgi:glucose/arabinose dehydrogenase
VNHVVHRLRVMFGPLVIVAMFLQQFAALFVPTPAQAQPTIHNPAENIFLDFYDNGTTPALECHPTYPTFGRCRNGSIANTGFTQVLPGTNTADTTKLLQTAGDPNDTTKNGTLRITTTAADIYAASTTQDNVLTLPFNPATQRFSIGVRLLPPFNMGQNYQSGGLVLGLDGNRYAKLVFAKNNGITTNGGKGLQFVIEDPAIGAGPGTMDIKPTPFPTVNPVKTLDLFLSADPITRKLTALYRVDSDDPDQVKEFSSVNWYSHYFSQTLYGGLVTTNYGTTTTFNFVFDWFKLGEFVAPGSAGVNVSFSAPAKIADQNNGAMYNPTTLAFGPDGRLYVGTYSGRIHAHTLDANGAVIATQTYQQIYNRQNRTCPTDGPDVPPIGQLCPVDTTVKGRQLLGIEFDPASTATNMALYITHSDPRFAQSMTANSKKIDTYSGTISRIRLNGAGTVTEDVDLVSGLPRSREYHSINGMDFGPDGWLYIAIGSNTNLGDDDNGFFSYLPEYYLSTAVLRANVNNAEFAPVDLRSVNSVADMAPYSGQFEIFSTGYRNPYDLTWHSNGKLYVNVNTSNSGLGGTPNDGNCTGYPKYTTGTENDDLVWATLGSYHGHPNPARSECVWRSGGYGSPPPPAPANYRAPVYTYNNGRSANGIVEYTANTFGGQMKGNIISAVYGNGKSIRRLVLNSTGTGVLLDQIIDQSLGTPLDVITDSTGNLYIADLGNQRNPTTTPGGIYRMKPNDTGTTPAFACKNSGINSGSGYNIDPARGDSDSDGYLDQDEIDNGTDVCNSSSKPLDYDNASNEHLSFKLSDRYDGDIDNDGVINNLDQLQFDTNNGAAATLPLVLTFENETRGIGKTGFDGVVLRGDAATTMAANNERGFGLYQQGSRLQANGVSGALGILGTDGTSRGALNNQDNGLQIGFNATAPFSITTETASPFDGISTTPSAIEEGGVFLGLDADTSVKFQMRRSSATHMNLVLTTESGGLPNDIIGPQISLPFTGSLRLALVAHPNEGYLAARYSIKPPSLSADYSPWATAATITVDSFPTLANIFRSPTCTTTANGCVTTAGLHVNLPNTAMGFTEFVVSPFPNLKAGNTTSGFTASRPSPTTGPVSLNWQTNGQARVAGFHVYRATTDDRNVATRITTTPIAVSGDPLETQNYSYSDGSAPINPVYYWLEPVLTSNAAGEALSTQLNSKANQSITFASLPDKTFGDAPFSLNATASSSLVVSYSASGQCSVNGTTVTITGAGSCTISASQAGNVSYNPAQEVERTFAIAKATASVNVPTATVTYNGTTQAVTPTTNPGALDMVVTYEGIETTTYGPSTAPPTDAGRYSVHAVIDAANYAGESSGTLTIQQAQAQVNLPATIVTYNGTAYGASASTNPSGLNLNLSYTTSTGELLNGEPVAAGVYTVTAVINEQNYAGEATGTVTINKAEAAISISDASVIFDGTPKSIAASVVPTLTLETVYRGFGSTTYGPTTTPPTNVGSYEVTATVYDANYMGSATAFLNINRSSDVTISIGQIDVIYTGNEQPVTVQTTPGVQSFTISYTGINGTVYGPSSTPPTEAGSYGVEINVVDPNRTGSEAAILVINPASATITLGNLSTIYNGAAQGASATSTPAGLDIDFSYTGIDGTSYGPTSIAPTNAGSYEVNAVLDERNYVGNATGTLVIGKANASIALSGLSSTYTGNPHSVAASSSPANLNIEVIYTGINGTSYGPSAVAPTNAGQYRVEATVNSENYAGSSDDTLIIARASQSISFEPIADKQLSDGSFAIEVSASSGLIVSLRAEGPCSLSGATVSLSGPGVCTITATQAGDGNYAEASLVRSFTIIDDTPIVYRLFIPMVDR